MRPRRRRAAGRGALAAAVASVLLLSAAGGRAEDSAPFWKSSPQRLALATGLPCLYQKDTASPTTVVGIFIGGGRSAVPPGLDGLAAISTRILLELSDEGKVQDLMAQATRLYYVCLEDVSIVVIECLTEHLDEALRVAAKIVQDPLISGLRVGRAKDLMKAYSRMDEDDPVAVGRNAIFAALFGGRGYGSALYGSAATLEAIDRKDVTAQVRRLVVRPNVTIGVQTDLEPGPVRQLLEKSFDKIPDGPAVEIAPQDPVLPDDRDLVVQKDTKQSLVGRAYALPRTDLADMAKASLLETVLGQWPGSRLWALRAEQRLAYSVQADLTWMKSAGVLVAHLETGRERGAEAAAALDRAIVALRDGGVTDEELKAGRAVVRTRFLRLTEPKSSRLRTIGLYETLGLGPEGVPDLLKAVEAVSLDEMNGYVREVLDPARALRVTVGPPAAGPAKEEPHVRTDRN